MFQVIVQQFTLNMDKPFTVAIITGNDNFVYLCECYDSTRHKTNILYTNRLRKKELQVNWYCLCLSSSGMKNM